MSMHSVIITLHNVAALTYRATVGRHDLLHLILVHHASVVTEITDLGLGVEIIPMRREQGSYDRLNNTADKPKPRY